MTDARYDYTEELSDIDHTLSFGKFKDMTPSQLVSTEKGRHYIVWAHRNTLHWVGSEGLVMEAHEICGEEYVPRSARPITVSPGSRDAVTAIAVDTHKNGTCLIAACEAATLEAFGCFPKPLWAR